VERREGRKVASWGCELENESMQENEDVFNQTLPVGQEQTDGKK
jgi:hypothetical protein